MSNSAPIYSSHYQFNVSFYMSPPEGFANLLKIIESCEERLLLYRFFQYSEAIGSESLIENLKDCPLLNLLHPEQTQGMDEAKYKDYISHWFLRLAYSKSDGIDYIFMKYEVNWFEVRLKQLNAAQKKQIFLETYPLPLAKPEELPPSEWVDPPYYKANWTEAPTLLKKRLYPLHKGTIYIPEKEILYYLVDQFAKNLRTSIKFIKKEMPEFHNDHFDTVMNALKLVAPTYTHMVDMSLKYTDLDDEAPYFPMCMQNLHEALRKTHHLKYFGRMQYGLFLKGIGLPLNETLSLFREEFMHDMTEQSFERKYSYLFRHQYGIVGGKINYKPYDCNRIQNIDQPYRFCDYHGCPYKHMGNVELQKKLKKEFMPTKVIEEIMKFKMDKCYAGACARHFQFVNNASPNELIVNPNQFYQLSVKKLYADEEIPDIEDLVSDS